MPNSTVDDLLGPEQTVTDLLGPEKTADELLGEAPARPAIKLSPYENQRLKDFEAAQPAPDEAAPIQPTIALSPYDVQRLKGPSVPMGPFGPANPDEVAALARAPGQVLGYLGNVARAVPADLAAGLRAEPDESGNIPAAAMGQPLPIDAAIAAAGAEEKEQGGFPWATASANVSQGVAKVSPKIAALSLAGPGLLAQSIAAGGLFGLDDQGNFNPKDAVLGALMPGVGKLARLGTGALLGKGIAEGVVPYGAATTHKVIETLGEQAALTGLMVAAKSPELLQQWKDDPQAFKRSLAEIVGTNLGYALLGAGRFKAGVPSEAQGFVRRVAQTSTDLILTKPVVQSGMDRAAEDYTDVESWREQGDRQPAGLLEEPSTPAKVKQATIRDRITSGALNPDDLVITVNTDPALPGWGFVQVDENSPTEGNVFSSNPEQLTQLGLPMPGSDQLLTLPSGKYTLEEAGALLARPPEAPTAPAPVDQPAVDADPFAPLEQPTVDTPTQTTEIAKGVTDELGQPGTNTPGVDVGESAGTGVPTAPAGQADGSPLPEESGGVESGSKPGSEGIDRGRSPGSGQPRSPGATGRTGERGQPPAETTGESGARDQGQPGQVALPAIPDDGGIFVGNIGHGPDAPWIVGNRRTGKILERVIGREAAEAAREKLLGRKVVSDPEAGTSKREYTDAEKRELAKRFKAESGIIDAERARVALEAERAREAESTPPATPTNVTEADLNHVLPHNEDWIPTGDKAKVRANLEAVQLLKKLEAENRNPSPAEKTILARYTGWGGLKSVFDEGKASYRDRPPRTDEQQTEFDNWEKNWGKLYDEVKATLTSAEHASAAKSILNAHFTSREAINGVWGAVKRLGFKGGRALENSAGVGNFVGLTPEDLRGKTQWRAVEVDDISGRILTKLYPQAAVHRAPFEKTSIKNNSQDLIIGNVPFRKDGPNDPRYPNFSLHNYFLARGMDLLKPGGLMAVITSDSTMDSDASRAPREWLAERADLVGAMRLPNNAFKKNAGTEVTTDVLFFRKHGEPFKGGQDFKRTEPFKTSKGPMPINEYFAQHPDMMLGKMSLEGTMYGPDQPALLPIPGANLPDQMAAATAKLPENVTQTQAPGAAPQTAPVMAVGGKLGQLTLKDGAVLQVQADGTLEAPDWASKADKVRQAKRYIDLRDIALEHIAKMLDVNSGDGEITASMVRLNKAYDAYVSKHGPLNARQSRFLDDDVDFPLALALEDGNTRLVQMIKEGKPVAMRVTDWVKSKMFSERTIFPRVPPERVDTISDGLQVSVNFKGKVDPDYIAQLTGQRVEAVKHELTSTGAAFENPVTGQWENRAKYLSGFVREKLKAAQNALSDNPEYAANIAELAKVQPPPIAIENIGVKLGSRWVPPSVIQNFLAQVLAVKAEVSLTEQTGDWHVRASAGQGAARNMTQFGIHGWGGHELVERALNLQTPVVTKSESYVNAEGNNAVREVKDAGKTAEASEKQQALQREFRKWVATSPDVARELQQIYNDKFNGVVAPKFEAPTWQHYPNASEDVTLREHQKAVVTRMLENSTLLAHAVGTGKTYAMVTAAMEMRRLGLAKKPMIVVQNATLEQFARSFKRLYPTARILAPGARDRDATKRQMTMSRIATGDWDAVIIPQSFINMMPDSAEREQAYISERLKDLNDALIEAKYAAGKKSPKAADLQRAITRLEERLDKLKDRAQDNVLTFEQTGVDAIFVDEAHAYKKLEFGTKMENIKGLDTGASQRGLSMFMKVRWVQEHNQGRNVTFATGTPISNTLAEAWNMMRYVRPDVLKAYSIEDFDSFASTFGDTRTKLERNAGGGLKPVTRFAKYTNGPELIAAWRTVADVVTPEEINLPGLPSLKNGKPTAISIPQTERLAKYVEHLNEMLLAFDRMSGREKRDNSHIPLVVFGLAKKATLDMRMIDPSLPDEPGSKLNRAADEITRIYNDSHSVKGAQMVFSDSYQDNPDNPRFNLYQELKRKLIERGVLEHEIVILTSEIKDAKREALFEKLNAGDTRVAIGSTERMGVGVNAQEHLIALHHLDAPPRPMDIEQRNGRMMRQGNMNAEVEILNYGVQKTLDAAMYDRLAMKQQFINQILRGDLQGRNFEDAANEQSMTFEEQMAAFSGDTRDVERIGLEHEVRALQSLRAGHYEQVRKSREEIDRLQESSIPFAERELAKAKEVAAEYEKAFPVGPGQAGSTLTLTHGKSTVAGKKEITEYLDGTFERGIKEAIAASKDRKEVGQDFIANAGTMELNGKKIVLGAEVPVADRVKGTLNEERATMNWKFADGPYSHNVKSGAGFFHSLQADLEGLIDRAPTDKAGQLEAHRRDLRELTGFVKQPFDKEAELADTSARLAKIEQELIAEGKEKHPAPGAEEETHEMAPPGRASNRPAGGAAPSAPALRPPRVQQPGSLAAQVASFQAAMAPQTLGDAARYAANLLRELNAKMANEMARADEALKVFRKDFDRTPLAKNYKYDPTLPLPRNLAFIDAYEGGNVNALSPRERDLALELKRQNDDWVNRVHALGGNALAVLLENYFPHVWSNPAKARAVFAQLLAKRPLEGPRSFLKQRTHEMFIEGLAAGLLPVHDNPIDQWLLKKREVERYILAHSFIQGMKEAGFMKFVHAFSRAPEGWATLNDRSFQVYGPPTVKIKEAYDEGMRSKTLDLLAKLGIPHERLAKIGGTRWGYETDQPGRPGTESIVTKFGGPDDVIWHELGHAIDNRYPDMRARLMATEPLREQLRALADLRFENTQASPGYQRMVRSTVEKMAVVLQAYLHAPDRMKAVAPDVYSEFARFIQSHPELHDINDIKPSLVLGVGQTEQAVGGLVKLGNYYMPEDAAKVVNNFLSPGLNVHLWYRSLREASNLMNGIQLGLSAFHLGFTSLDAAVSRLAVGLQDVSRGRFASAATTIASTPLAPATNFWAGRKLRDEILHPGSHPALADIARALEAAGGRIGQDRFWQTEFTRRMFRALHEGTASGYLKGAVAAPFALFEQTMRPIMEYVVPRQKLGVFADLAKRELLNLGPMATAADTRAAMQRAWDSVDNRMGQLVYDNLFYNRAVKDLALLSFRAFGWQLGKYRELGGGAIDWAKQIADMSQGKKPELTPRMAYMLALPILVGLVGAIITRLATGENPKDYRDYFMPRTGEKGKDGKDRRVVLPSYMKDILSLAKQPIKTVAHSMNPLIAAVADMLMNKDYWGVRIFEPDDPLPMWLKDAGGFAAKQFVPFSVGTAMNSKEEGSATANMVLPFFGITPAKRALTMTPAESLAADITQKNQPVGGRTRASADHSRLLRELAQDIRDHPPRGVKLDPAITQGLLRPGDAERLSSMVTLKPLQYQVKKMSANDAMRVWRVASPEEKAMLQGQVIIKLAENRSTMDPDLVDKYMTEVSSQGAPNGAPGKN